MDDKMESAELPPPPLPALPPFSPSDFEKMDGRYEVVFRNFRVMREEARKDVAAVKVTSEVFRIGKYEWRLLVFPAGNPAGSDNVSVYLDVADPDLPTGWHRFTKFRMCVKTSTGAEKWDEACHNFIQTESDWGFPGMLTAKDFIEDSRGVLHDDTLSIYVETKVIKDYADYSLLPVRAHYDSKGVLGFVGIKNNGGTDRVGTCVQILYHLPVLRWITYHLPSPSPLLLSLQILLCRLQEMHMPASAKDLVEKMGLGNFADLMERRPCDVLRVLIREILENGGGSISLKGVLVGEAEVTVGRAPPSTLPFWELNLNVDGLAGVAASLAQLCEGTKEEEAPLDAPSAAYTLSAAPSQKVRFRKLPNVLFFTLNRSVSDASFGVREVTDPFEFPREMKIAEHTAAGVEQVTYQLFGVIAQSGGQLCGAYSAFVQSYTTAQWLLIEDTSVEAVREQAVLATVGTKEEAKFAPSPYANLLKLNKSERRAVVLVYVRAAVAERVFDAKYAKESPPAHIREGTLKDVDDAVKKFQSKNEAYLSMSVTVLDEEALVAHCRNIPDLLQIPAVEKVKVRKTLSLREFRRELAGKKGVHEERIRFWTWVVRKNKTFRPDKPLDSYEMMQTFQDLERSFPENIYYIEISELLHFPYFPRADDSDDAQQVLVFLKQFDVHTGELSLIGARYFDRHDSLHAITHAVAKDVDVSRPLRLYEEVKPSLLLPLTVDNTFFDEGLSNGDIVICELGFDLSSSSSLSSSLSSSSRRGCVEWFELQQHRGWVQFTHTSNPKVSFSLFLSKKLSLVEVKKEIATHLKCGESSVCLVCHVPSDSISLDALLRISNPRGTVVFDVSP